MRLRGVGLVLILVLLAGCSAAAQPAAAPASTASGGVIMKLSSPAFTEGGMIPVAYTCDGDDFSPPLAWRDVPAGTRSLALICDDPDAPVGTWVHWVAFNLPPTAGGLPEGIRAEKQLPGGGLQGINGWKRAGYGGPCPPSGVHRYFFKLYALDTMLSLDNRTTAKDLTAAIKGHVLAEAQTMGRYRR